MKRVALVCRGCDTVYPLDLPEGVDLGDETVTCTLECCQDSAMAVLKDVCKNCRGEGSYTREGSGRTDVCDVCGGSGRMTERVVRTRPEVRVGRVIPADEIPF